jgi:MFS family permease
MDFFFHRDRINFYQNSPRGKILRAMTLSDISFWGSYNFIKVILILFVIQFIDGGSATHLGLAFLVYKGFAAALSISIGRFFDRHKGYLDEMWGLALASFATGGVYIALSFSTHLWQLYTAMLALGFLSVVNMSSWRILFYNHIEKAEYGRTIGIYMAILSLAEGLALALGGFFGDTFGFDKVVFYGGVVAVLGGLIPLTVKYFLLPDSKKSD